MKHFELEDWADYVRGTLSDFQRTLMRRHLAEGCPACEGFLGAMERVHELARVDRELNLPPSVERSVKALGHQLRLVEPALRPVSSLQLVFDSRLAPAAAGARGGQAPTRQLMYMSEGLSLDLQLVASTDAQGPRVCGEVIERVSGQLAAVRVSLLAGDRVLAEDETGELGDFDLPIAVTGGLRLRLEPEGREAVELALPNSIPAA